FEFNNEDFLVTDLISVQALDRGFFGSEYEGRKTKLRLMPEEALYLIDVRNAECLRSGKQITFNQAAVKFQGHRKFLARFFCYRDWRNRGIIPRNINEATGNYGRSPVIKYPGKPAKFAAVKAKGVFFFDDLMTVIDDNDEGFKLYEEDWFGQFGTYKAKKHGQFLKLDAFETLFLMKHAGFETNIKDKRLLKEASARRHDFKALYDVYEDFRLRGFVVKTGFKFGTHFRLYFPGASPKLEIGDWVHSKHVIHVFPRETTMIISEWARAIRVAHGVRKTFILAIPGSKRVEKGELDFLLYHRRKGGIIENPKDGKPKFAMLALSEEEELGGAELAAAIERAKNLGLDLVLAICDRETAITYYRVKRIELPESKYEYYEIEWIQP
ncbi:MAG: tRNA-intron lyase, partial [Candidatus Micrarchaeota archaeon]